MKYLLALLWNVLMFAVHTAHAAVGCTLSNPAEDLKYLFPELTSYKEELKSFDAGENGSKLYQDLKQRLGSDLDPIYESQDTPYTIYTVYKGDGLIGVVHGVNVPGKGGVIQVFLSVDPQSGEIRSFFFQRLESPAAKALRKKEFRDQFRGLSLADFYKHDYYSIAGSGSGSDKVGAIRPPELPAEGEIDYAASIRGIRKNLILLDLFFYGRRFESFFARAQEALAKRLNKEQ